MAVPSAEAPIDGDLVAWLDTVEIRPRVPLGDRPSDAVRTTRGTHSTMLYSRGNTVPAVGLPHGAMMATPVTRAGERHWLYAWHAHNDDDNRSRIEAFATTLSPSPWIGERGGIPRDARHRLADRRPSVPGTRVLSRSGGRSCTRLRGRVRRRDSGRDGARGARRRDALQLSADWGRGARRAPRVRPDRRLRQLDPRAARRPPRRVGMDRRRSRARTCRAEDVRLG